MELQNWQSDLLDKLRPKKSYRQVIDGSLVEGTEKTVFYPSRAQRHYGLNMKKLNKRRAKNKVARQSRKANR